MKGQDRLKTKARCRVWLEVQSRPASTQEKEQERDQPTATAPLVRMIMQMVEGRHDLAKTSKFPCAHLAEVLPTEETSKTLL